MTDPDAGVSLADPCYSVNQDLGRGVRLCLFIELVLVFVIKLLTGSIHRAVWKGELR